MSLHHNKLAQVWISLQGRHDIAGILREIIGQQSIDSALNDNDAADSESSIEAVIWIKTIFDLQRCYLSGIANGAAECPPYVFSYLLPPELLLSSILYLVNLKTRLFPSQTTLITKEFTRPRQILAQTILSGLRLLLLKKEHVAPHGKRRLQKSINSAWQNDRLHGVERFIVSDLFAQILDSLATGAQDPAHTVPENPYINEWRNARLPTFAAGLYPLDIRPETFVTPLIHGTMEEDWIDAYWVLFDCLWAVECAVVQRLVDLHRHRGMLTQQDADTDDALEHLYHTRTSLIISIFHITGPMTPLPALLESLALTLLDWNEDIDSFLSRQDSLMQQRSSNRPTAARLPSYGKQLAGLRPYYEAALTTFAVWLCSRKPSHEQFTIRKPGILPDDVEELVKDWITRMTATSGETLSRELDGPILPAYIVDCPKLHVVPKKHLEYKLRWCDKWAYESIQENSPIVNWKEGVHCPSCISGEKIRFARLIEPFQNLAAALENLHSDAQSVSQYSIGESCSYDAASASFNSAPSESDSAAISLPSRSAAAMSLPSHSSRPSAEADIPTHVSPPGYTESPISPASPSMIHRAHSQGSSLFEGPVSPLSESLDVPIPLASRLSVDLPIPVRTPSISDSLPSNIPASAPSEMSSIRLDTPSSDSIRSGPSATKQKPPSRTALRFANSIRRRTTTKEKETYPLPKDPAFVFSSSGHSLLLWGRDGSYIVRFDIPSNDTSAIQGCRYDISDIEAVAAGNHKCAIMTASGREHMSHHLTVYDGMKLSSAYKIDIEFQGHAKNICLAVSRNDRYAAVSINDHIEIFRLEDDGIKVVPFHHQIHVYEMRGGISHRRTIPMGRTTSQDSVTEPDSTEACWFGVQQKGLSSKEAAEEQMRQSAIISRKLYFSPDSTRLAVATQLGDHCVYVDVWDCTREPVSTISEHSRSFSMPPWTLNDGDLTSVFYDSQRRCALVTAFLGKEYPMLIPFPGYDTLQNETYSTKIVHAAQSPSGASLVVANAMTEVIHFEYTVKSTLSPRKLKRSASKIPHSVFKPGAIAMAMPLENILQCFWIKDGRCMLRTIRVGENEGYREVDLRSNFERLMGLKRNPVVARAPSLMIPEMEGD
ncbi:uncharacterized protein EI97DRAFT_435373 [Westerdykella ornata]|uniref:WD40 repeat-like protein n=1 Tax=Westerdykella ornata TaxID=318751 RepID=A0A6A6JDD7_WESOR|nr:uncharacterized protein EI97DRAFT_435373 [Westerdykella ornata]KAF2274287.1 hypothetical protein EI97DRAFT_435373 [Westerdykella ornata]